MEINLSLDQKILYYAVGISQTNFMGRMQYTASINTLHLKKKLVRNQKLTHTHTSHSLSDAIDSVIRVYILDDKECGGNKPELIRDEFLKMYLEYYDGNQ